MIDTLTLITNPAVSAFDGSPDRRIEVTPGRIRALQDMWQRRWGRLPVDKELQDLVHLWVHDEVLYREAMARGLDRDDELVRRRLVQKMEHLAVVLTWANPPSPEEVRAYFDAHLERYTDPAERTFSHVFFDPQRRSEAEADALAALAELTDVLAEADADQFGDRLMLPRHFARLSPAEVTHRFGRDFASALFTFDPGQWQGPIRSAFGLHLVLVQEEFPAQSPQLEEVYERVLEDLIEQRRREAAEQLYLAMVDTYEVVLDDDEDGYIEGLDHLREVWKDRAPDEASREQLEELHMKVNAILPPRYQGRTDEISAAPMPAAELVFDADGNVMWDRVWGQDDPNQPFCELALAGGPANRGTLLEPVSPQEALSDLDAYGYVLQQLARGISTVTGRPVVMCKTPGWIGVQCDSEEMAIWLLRSIIVENVIVRREGHILYLPAGPRFTLKGEIKNVVTACAKTFHYWKQHIAALEDHHEE
jgi:hypothetical protein